MRGFPAVYAFASCPKRLAMAKAGSSGTSFRFTFFGTLIAGTARSFFPRICTTHDYEEDVATVRAVKRAGMTVCSGGIFGMGESPAQRVEMALTLRELDVDSVPLNFLNPIEGTRLAGASNITPMDCLVTIAIYRLLLPAKKITICGGREKNLRDLQSWMFFAGASGTMIGNYLTTTGRCTADDWQMLKDLELSSEGCCE